ncbi:MAG: endonuclease V [Anaerolineae bacterium]|nr:endonuclease V [Anaerolineae bacterium]
MYFSCDVQYEQKIGYAAGICFQRLQSQSVDFVVTAILQPVAEYKPGEFYQRELPCLIELIKKLETLPKIIFIDGYVWLQNDQLALGGRLYEYLDRKVIVIGIAKSFLRIAGENISMYYKSSHRPIYISAAGLSLDDAMQCVKEMPYQGHLPLMMKYADIAARNLCKNTLLNNQNSKT